MVMKLYSLISALSVKKLYTAQFDYFMLGMFSKNQSDDSELKILYNDVYYLIYNS